MIRNIFGAIATVLAGLAAETAAAGDPVAGRALAMNVCSGCHLVAADQAGPVSDGVPAFHAMARDPGLTDQALRGFIVDPHPQMPQVSLTPTEIDSIIAYVRSLVPR